VATLEDICSDPGWYPNKLLVPFSKLEFCSMSQESYRDSPFLDHRIIKANATTETLAFNEIGVAVAHIEQRPTHFIFHNAFACSTLLTRYLDALAGPLLLREPNSLYELATLQRFAGTPMLKPLQHVSWDVLFQFLLRLLGRRYQNDYATIIKPTDGCNNIMQPLLAAHAENRAVFIYAPLERFLVSILRHAPRHEWVRVRVRELLFDIYKETGSVPVAPETLTIEQATALVWMLHTDRYLACVQTMGSRCVSIDADHFVANPTELVHKLVKHFELGYTREEVADRLGNAQVSVHSKSASEGYDEQRREQEFAMARVQYGEQIERAIAWSGAFCVSRKLDDPLPNLLG